MTDDNGVAQAGSGLDTFRSHNSASALSSSHHSSSPRVGSSSTGASIPPADDDLAVVHSQLLSSARRFRATIRHLKLELSQCRRDQDQLVVSLEERLEREVGDARSIAAISRAKAEEFERSWKHTKEYAESLQERWKNLEEAHDLLMVKCAQQQGELQASKLQREDEKKQMEEKLTAVKNQLKTEVVDAEFKAHKAQENAQRLIEELKQTHAAEKKRLAEQWQRDVDDARDKHRSAVADLTSKHDLALRTLKFQVTNELVQSQKTSETARSKELDRMQEKYEAMLRVADESIRKQQSELQRLEEVERQLHAIIDNHDTKLHELHEAHLQDLHKRLSI